MRACAATLMRECSWRRGDGVAGGGTAGKRKPILLRSHDRPARNEPVIYVSPRRRCLMISVKISDGLGIYVDSCAKVAREIEIRRVTENLDAIKCTSDL